MDHTVECLTYNGDTVKIPAADLTFRAAVYAVIVADGRLLVIHEPRNLFYFPGGGVERGERRTVALCREVAEETGIAIDVGPLIYTGENFFYFNPTREAWHAFHFVYRAAARSTTPSPTWDALHRDAEHWSWVELRALRPEHFLETARPIIAAIGLLR